VAQGSLLSFLLSFAYAGYLTRFQIQPEERLLAEKFGEQYAQYCAHVRRWL